MIVEKQQKHAVWYMEANLYYLNTIWEFWSRPCSDRDKTAKSMCLTKNSLKLSDQCNLWVPMVIKDQW